MDQQNAPRDRASDSSTQIDPSPSKKLAYWKSRLIDLSKRNRLVNFKETKSSTINLTHPTLEEIFARLVTQEKTLTFVEPAEDVVTSESSNREEAESNTEPPRQLKAHEVFGSITGDKVTRVLYNLRLRARTAVQETGINVLYVAFGMLEWTEASHSNQTLRSPVVLVPVQLDRESILEPYTLKALESEIVINPALVQKLQSDFGISIPNYEDITEDATIVPVLQTLRDLISKRSDWQIINEVYLGLFSFSKLVMYMDLERYADVALSHGIIRALAGDESLLPSMPDNLPRAEELDDRVLPIETFQVLDADSSQQEAIIAAKKGVSFVLQGPPGTGKSQTIANIISECLADGKRVLFVSEKMAALDVVKKRLDSCGLGEYCLELHSHKANKRTVIEELNKTLNSPVPQTEKDYSQELKHLKSLRDKLNVYVQSLHRKQSKLRITPFEAHEALITVNSAPNIRFSLSKVHDIDQEQLQHLTSLLTQLANLNSVLSRYYSHPWYGFSFESAGFELISDLQQHLLSLRNDLALLDTVASSLANQLQILPPQNLRLIYRLDKLLKEFKPEILQLDVHKLLQDFKTRYKGISRYVKASYWRDLKLVRSTSRGDAKLTKSEIIQALETMQQIESELGKSALVLQSSNIGEFLSELSSTLQNVINHLHFLSGFFAFDKQQINGQLFDQLSLSQAQSWLNDKLEHLAEISEWIAFEKTKKEAEQAGLKEFLEIVMHESIDAHDILPAFKKRLYQLWIDAAHAADPVLREFSGNQFRSLINEFKELDKQQFHFARERVSQKLAQQRPHEFFANSASSEQAKLRKEGAKKRRHKPIRQLFSEISNLLLTLKPCFLMSPLSISHFLDPSRFAFDIVVFDEASQILPEDAVGAIMRGKQTIVVGDDKQLPPTEFFSSMETDEFTDEEVSEMGAFDSILEECSGINLPQVMLKWHYRSEDESLISFSNFHFYDNALNTFPSSHFSNHSGGIEFIYVPDGVYDMGKSRQNIREARRVSELVFEHFKQFPSNSLGVVAFSQAQQMAILDQLEVMRRTKPEFESFFDENKEEAFFVKNLENVQGDERDVMFFSVGYGKDGSGKPLPLRFGPLNNEGGHRRLNVAITRAKKHVKLISSIQPTDIDLSRTNSYGVKLLRNYMEYAQRKGDTSVLFGETQLSSDADFDSPFEQEVWKALTEKGFTVHNQIGCSGYKIDLAVVNPQQPGQFILGIECDGASYHSSKTARDRDRLRQQVLEQKYGWRIHRIWSRDWIDAREHELEKLITVIGQIQQGVYQLEIPKTESPTIERINKPSTASQKQIQEHSQQHALQNPHPKGVRIYQEVAPSDLQDLAAKSHHNPEGALIDAVARVVQLEGPIHISEAAKRVAKFYGAARAGQRIQRQVQYAADRCKNVVEKKEFLWPKDMKKPVVRVPQKGHTPRDIEHIDIAEIGEAAILCINNAFSMTRDDLITQTAKLLGYNRTGEKIKDRVSDSIDMIIASGEVTQEGGIIKKSD